jgi:hypothetical protein
MPRAKRAILLVAMAAISALAATPALAVSSSSENPKAGINAHALFTSRQLWATIDVCSPTDQPDTVGIRGSMPADGHANDKMYMSFRLQYLDATNRWVDLLSGAAPDFVAVGRASARQGGRSFQLVPVAGKPAVTLRGVVDFQWRRGRTVLERAARPTTPARKSLAGADPAGYSAATCLIG